MKRENSKLTRTEKNTIFCWLLSEKSYTQTSQLKANYVVHFHTAPASKTPEVMSKIRQNPHKHLLYQAM